MDIFRSSSAITYCITVVLVKLDFTRRHGRAITGYIAFQSTFIMSAKCIILLHCCKFSTALGAGLPVNVTR